MHHLAPNLSVKNLNLKNYRFSKVKQIGRKRPYTIAIRLSLIERKMIDDRRGNLSIADFLRASAIGQNIVKKQIHRITPPKVDPDLLRQLGWIGNNLNQLTRLANEQNNVNALDRITLSLELATIRQQLNDLKIYHTAGSKK